MLLKEAFTARKRQFHVYDVTILYNWNQTAVWPLPFTSFKHNWCRAPILLFDWLEPFLVVCERGGSWSLPGQLVAFYTFTRKPLTITYCLEWVIQPLTSQSWSMSKSPLSLYLWQFAVSGQYHRPPPWTPPEKPLQSYCDHIYIHAGPTFNWLLKHQFESPGWNHNRAFM